MLHARRRGRLGCVGARRGGTSREAREESCPARPEGGGAEQASAVRCVHGGTAPPHSRAGMAGRARGHGHATHTSHECHVWLVATVATGAAQLANGERPRQGVVPA